MDSDHREKNEESEYLRESPFIINGESYAQFKAKSAAQRRLEQVETEHSQMCKQCIMDKNLWCPTSNYKAGFCCSGVDGIQSCPRATACSDDFDIPELQYMTCPNEDNGCVFDRNLEPPSDGSVALYEKTLGEFYERDICTFSIENPSSSDFNDVMNLRIEWFRDCFPVLIKGTSVY